MFFQSTVVTVEMPHDEGAMVCNADLIKNVWEIRTREQFHKHQNEAARLESSALEK